MRVIRKITHVFVNLSILCCCLILTTCAKDLSDANSSSTPKTKRQNARATYDANRSWDILRKHFSLKDASIRPEVQQQIKWLIRNPNFMAHLSDKSEPYIHYIHSQILTKKMPMEFVLIPMIESSFDPFAYSNAGAAGLWQIMPGTATALGIKQNWWYDGRRDIRVSTKGALNHLKGLSVRFNGNWLHAIAAYNVGGGKVSSAIRKNKNLKKSTEFWDLDLPKETKRYVPRLLAIAHIIKHHHKYKVDLPHLNHQKYFQEVDVGSQIDLAHAAKLAELDVLEMYKLNPGFNRWVTAPNGPHKLLVPIAKAEHFKGRLNGKTSQKKQDQAWLRYKVKSGDTLSIIAQNHKTSVAMLQKANQLKSNSITPSMTLLIPKGKLALNDTDIKKMKSKLKIVRRTTGPKKITHKVTSGQTLSHIAKEYKVSLSQLQSWNHLKKTRSIKDGQTLTIWQKQPKIALNYKVRKGDSLNKIAQRFGVSLTQIKSWNPNVKSSVIQIGQRVKLRCTQCMA